MLILEIIAKIVLVGSLIGMLVIFFRKVPLLADMPKTTSVFEKRGNAWLILFRKLKEKLKNLPFLKDFSSEIFLQKILSSFRVFALRLENKTAQWLEILRKRSRENKTPEKKDDKYWEALEEKKKEQ
ncbi:MAG: hypothetical protein Q8N65_02375 [bacterium]|nr:hypothetical protein [bacterium]